MNTEAGRAHSQMFVLRVWAEEVAPGRVEMRGLVKHVLSGEAIYFREWPVLRSFLEKWTPTGREPVPNASTG